MISCKCNSRRGRQKLAGLEPGVQPWEFEECPEIGLRAKALAILYWGANSCIQNKTHCRGKQYLSKGPLNIAAIPEKGQAS